MRVGDAEGRVFQGAKWAGGCDVLSRSVEVTERSRGGEGRIGANQLGGESGDGGEISRFDSTEESGD